MENGVIGGIKKVALDVKIQAMTELRNGLVRSEACSFKATSFLKRVPETDAPNNYFMMR